MNIDQITESLKKLQEQLDEVLVILKELQDKKKAKSASRRPKAKTEPLTEGDIVRYKDQFNQLYGHWLGGDEVRAGKVVGVAAMCRHGQADTMCAGDELYTGVLLVRSGREAALKGP